MYTKQYFPASPSIQHCMQRSNIGSTARNHKSQRLCNRISSTLARVSRRRNWNTQDYSAQQHNHIMALDYYSSFDANTQKWKRKNQQTTESTRSRSCRYGSTLYWRGACRVCVCLCVTVYICVHSNLHCSATNQLCCAMWFTYSVLTHQWQ